jgi:precorrin-6A/cobalt-precorrin-6A reductase
MILLLGGTSDTKPLARRLVDSGRRVLVSTATDISLDVGGDTGIRRRCGLLDDAGLTELIRQHRVETIVDATHPYAAAIRERARRVAAAQGIRYVTLVRPAVIGPDEANVEFADDHQAAAHQAFAHGRPVLVTTGSKNLEPYAAQATATGLPLIVRVLDHADSLAACRRAGLGDEQVLAGRGPFTTEHNLHDLQRYGIGVLVTKDSGHSGGTREKLAAARRAACRVVVLRRPAIDTANAFAEIDSLIAGLTDLEQRR